MPVSIVNSVTGSVGVVMVCLVMERHRIQDNMRKVFNYIGKNSLIIMLVPPTILLLFTYPFGGIFGKCIGVTGVMGSLALFIILVVAEIPFIWVINKYLPWMIGKKKKAVQTSKAADFK